MVASARLLLVAGLALSLLACGTTQVEKPKPPEKPKTVEEEISRAAEVATAQERLVVRYNPARCQCPAFEVQLGPHWVRLEVSGADDKEGPAAVLLGRAKADLGAGRIPHYRFKGELSSSPKRCAQGAYYLSASVESLD